MLTYYTYVCKNVTKFIMDLKEKLFVYIVGARMMTNANRNGT